MTRIETRQSVLNGDRQRVNCKVTKTKHVDGERVLDANATADMVGLMFEINNGSAKALTSAR